MLVPRQQQRSRQKSQFFKHQSNIFKKLTPSFTKTKYFRLMLFVAHYSQTLSGIMIN